MSDAHNDLPLPDWDATCPDWFVDHIRDLCGAIRLQREEREVRLLTLADLNEESSEEDVSMALNMFAVSLDTVSANGRLEHERKSAIRIIRRCKVAVGLSIPGLVDDVIEEWKRGEWS